MIPGARNRYKAKTASEAKENRKSAEFFKKIHILHIFRQIIASWRKCIVRIRTSVAAISFISISIVHTLLQFEFAFHNFH